MNVAVAEFIFGRGEENETFVIALVVIGGEMRRYWREIIIGLLALSLLIVVADSIVEHNKYVAMQSELTQVRQTLVNQTQLIVELRQKLLPKNFDSLDDLNQWVSNWEKNNKPVVVSILNHTFVIAGNIELYSYYWDCDDISEAMQRDALKDGYLMSVALVSAGGVMLDHAGCMVITENAYWFVEPQTGEIAIMARRD